jgi:hypothetical protein
VTRRRYRVFRRDRQWLTAALVVPLIAAELVSSGSPSKEPDPIEAHTTDRGSLHRLFVRERDGVAVRVYWSESRQADICGPGPCPPPRCLPSGAITAGMSTKAAVGNGLALRYDDPIVPLVATSGYIGAGENAPVAWAIVQVARATNAKLVRAKFADGATDEMRPRRGIAVLVHAIPSDGAMSTHIGEVEAVDTAGKVVATRELVAAPGPDVANQEVLGREECQPIPLRLPEPNGPPPDNESRARDAVIDAYRAVYNGKTTDDEKASRVEDPRGVRLAFATARTNFAEALAKVTIRVKDVRFVNRAEAAVAYDIVIPNYSPIPEIPGRHGRAVLVDGEWKVAHATICTDLQLAGASC